MKFKNLLISLGLVLSVGAGIGTALSVKDNYQEADAIVNYAATTSGQKMFLDISSYTDWSNDGAYFALYFFDGSKQNAWTSATNSTCRANTYCFEVPKLNSVNHTWTTVIAVRLKSSWAGWGDSNSNVHNKTGDLSITSNGIAISGWNSGAMTTVYGLNSGESIYINYNDVTWWNNGAGDGTYNHVYFFNALDASAATWSDELTVVHGTNDKLLEATVPGSGKVYYSIIVVRCKTAKSFTDAWSQTVDFYPISTTASSVNNAINVQSGTDGTGKYYINWETSYRIGDAARATFWGTYFLNQITCGGDDGDANDGTITAANPSIAWDNVETEFNNVTTSIQTIIKDKAGSISGADNLAKAVYRYDYIVFYKMPLDPSTYNFVNDFADREHSAHPSFSIVKPVTTTAVESNNSTLIIIVLLSSISMLAIGGYFFIRRKSER